MYFFRKYKNRIIVALVVIILFITMGMTNSKTMEITGAENFLGNIFSPINKFFYGMGSRITDSFGSIKGIFSLKEENEKLKAENLELKDKNRDLENIIGKSDFLEEEFELSKKTDLNLISAQVTSKEPGNWYSTFTIDKGRNDGIKKDDIIIQGVRTEGEIVQEGLVGRVIEVGNGFSKVSSIIDEENSVSFKTIRTQDGGMIKGSIDSAIEGYLFDRKADVVAGDKLYTSGLGKGYKSDIYIGEVEEVIQIEEELMKKIVVEPAIDFKKIYKVFAIID